MVDFFDFATLQEPAIVMEGFSQRRQTKEVRE
jgi:hypothetical protein